MHITTANNQNWRLREPRDSSCHTHSTHSYVHYTQHHNNKANAQQSKSHSDAARTPRFLSVLQTEMKIQSCMRSGDHPPSKKPFHIPGLRISTIQRKRRREP